MRKVQDDVMAREAAERVIGDVLEAEGLIDSEAQESLSAGRAVLNGFKAEFETTDRKIGTEEIHLRRLVLTGAWVVDLNAK